MDAAEAIGAVNRAHAEAVMVPPSTVKKIDATKPDAWTGDRESWHTAVHLVRNRKTEQPTEAAERLSAYIGARAERWPNSPLTSLQGLVDMANGGREW